MPLPSNMAVAAGSGDLDPGALLGQMVFYSLPDTSLNTADLRQAWTSAGLPGSLLPDDVNPVNVFKRACRQVETKRTGTKDVEVKVDQVLDDAGAVIYQITRMSRDHVAEQLGFEREVTVKYDKTHKVIQTTFTKSDEMNEVIRRIEDFFQEHATRTPPAEIRGMFREAIVDADGTSMRRRGGGVYFIPKDKAETVEALVNVAERVYDGDRTIFNSLPMIDSRSAREVVQGHHDANVQAELDRLLSETKEKLGKLRLEGKAANKRTIQSLVSQQRTLRERAQRYSELLGDEQDVAQIKLDAAQRQIEALIALEAIVPPAAEPTPTEEPAADAS